MDFCENFKCPFPDCEHHHRNAPGGCGYVTRKMYLDCERWKEREEKRRKMTMGDAYGIFANIDTVDLDDEIKGEAVWKIVSMPTHMGVTKDMMLRVIRWLMGLIFDIPDKEG